MRSFVVPALFGLACLLAGAAAWAADAGRGDLDAATLKRVLAVTAPTAEFSAPERFETMEAGAATSSKLVNPDAFSQFSANLAFEGQQRFALGNGLFRKDWVSAPSSTQASDGLGPLFNARACQSCHIKDGRGHAPVAAEDTPTSLLVRISAPDGKGGYGPDPVYGSQLQDFAVAGLAAEGRVRFDYTEVPVALGGGEAVTLRRPALAVTGLGYGPLAAGAVLSARVAPAMIGLGLLENIAASDILARADADDRDGDGISGRPNWVIGSDGGRELGRFGWKAAQPDVGRQSAAAFSGDMGLSTPMHPDHWGECTAAEAPCRDLPHGAQPQLGSEEVPGPLFDLVAFYAQHLAVPARRDVGDLQVLAGKRAFYEAGCPACHTPKYVTRRDAGDPALRFQLIWPYSDLLLHDMGPELADHRPEGEADGYEWRTPPLWGIGLSQVVSPEAGFLHDGRARTLLEAVLWHGGEAEAARDRVVAMDAAERAALVRFLESL